MQSSWRAADALLPEGGLAAHPCLVVSAINTGLPKSVESKLESVLLEPACLLGAALVAGELKQLFGG